MKIKNLLIRPSTRSFFREARHTRGYSFLDWIHGYVYSRWPYTYIGIAIGEHPLLRLFGPILRLLDRLLLFRSPDADSAGISNLCPAEAGAQKNSDRTTFAGTSRGKVVPMEICSRFGMGRKIADSYHGKVVPIEAATQLVTVDKEICLTDLEQVIPYALARDIVLRNPDHIVVLDCPCRFSRSNPCLPIDVCLIVGEPFASFVAEHHPNRSRWITPEEAVEILRAEDERGHVHHAFFKDAMLGRFYAICNCCSCCCGAIQAHRNGIPMLASSGYVSSVDNDICLGCGLCNEVCQFGALSMSDGIAVVDGDICMGCGVCVSKCLKGALSLVRNPIKGEPLYIYELTSIAGGQNKV
jgi:ferredoxin